MKIVRLTLATTLAAFLMLTTAINVYGDDAKIEANHQSLSCAGGCNDGCGHVCPHGFRQGHCQHGCLTNHYGYGRMKVCPGKRNGICPVHGYGACPHQREPFGPALREALTPADRPYFGMQPMMSVPCDQDCRFPRLRALLFCPPAPRYMTTAPPAPMPTYTTRGPRDFLNPNPPSIGY